MSRIWMGPNGALLTDEQVLRHIATFGSMSAALEEGDIVLETETKPNPKRKRSGHTGRLSDYLGDDKSEPSH